MRDGRGPRQAGFTLVELLVVIAIIGIIISLILVAAADGVRRAEERATQSLITKLDFALNDRIDALFNTQAPINQTHRYLAAINYEYATKAYRPTPNSIEARAQVIAQNDFIRAELPDVFFLNSKTKDGTSSKVEGSYPLNFGGVPYPPGSNAATSFLLPMGHFSVGLSSSVSAFTPTATGGTGILGASYSAAGGIYKNLGYREQGYDGVDNTGNGFIDEFTESGMTLAELYDVSGAKRAKNEPTLINHKHKTARAEMLYAILVEGLGPLGSVFNREDFTDKEVRDTDNDGLPEFVDAWGEPLQFYRWPIYYGAVPATSDTQKGYLRYGGPSETRQQDNFDPNQQLVAPGWWYGAANPGFPTVTGISVTVSDPNPSGPVTSGKMSKQAILFTSSIRSLVDPKPFVDPKVPGDLGSMWDRTDAMNRRAYFSRFLILSSGPDKEPGVAQFAKNYDDLINSPTGTAHTFSFPDAGLTMEQNAQRLILIENQASQTDPLDRSGSFFEKPDTTATTTDVKWQTTNYLQSIAGTDDITNHNISAPGTGVR